MKARIVFFAAIVTFCMLCSCNLFKNPTVYNGISTKRVHKQYSPEPLYLKYYFYYYDEYNMTQKNLEFDPFKNQDSTLWQTKNSLIKTNLNLIIDDTLINKANAQFIRRTGTVLRPRLTKGKFILENIPDNKTYIVPAFHSRISRLYELTTLQANPQNDFSGLSEYVAIVFIIKNKKIIYKRAVRYWALHTQTGPAITDYRSDVRLEHLGLIVEKAMEDYIKRIKKVE
jgi:hypothetical protein